MTKGIWALIFEMRFKGITCYMWEKKVLCLYLLCWISLTLKSHQIATVWFSTWNRWEPSTVCVPECVWCVGALVQGYSVPWCGLELGSHADTAARPICASHTVTITELLTLEASSSHIAVKPLTMPRTPIPRARSYSAATRLPVSTFTVVD